MKKFLGVLLSVCLLLGLTAFPAAASGETSDRVMFVQCDTQNMTANFYFTPNPGAYWSEMGIYTEPQDGWDQDSSGKLVRLSNIVPSSLWRVGPSSMTDGDGKVNGTQILDSHFEFTAGVTYYVYMCYYDGANWNVIPDYYSFVFEDGPADGDVFDEDQLILHAELRALLTTAATGVILIRMLRETLPAQFWALTITAEKSESVFRDTAGMEAGLTKTSILPVKQRAATAYILSARRAKLQGRK